MTFAGAMVQAWSRLTWETPLAHKRFMLMWWGYTQREVLERVRA